jgi:hypothetical protein
MQLDGQCGKKFIRAHNFKEHENTCDRLVKPDALEANPSEKELPQKYLQGFSCSLMTPVKGEALHATYQCGKKFICAHNFKEHEAGISFQRIGFASLFMFLEVMCTDKLLPAPTR